MGRVPPTVDTSKDIGDAESPSFGKEDEIGESTRMA